MATREEAIKITIEFLNNRPEYDGYVVDSTEVIDKDYVWYVPFKEINPAPNDILVGAYNGLIVDKESDEYFQPGSALKLDDWIYGFRIGLRGNRYDLVIKKINNHNESLEILSKLGLTYVKIEIEGGTEWKIPKQFNIKEIKKRLEKLPCVFKNQSFTFSIEAFKKIRNMRLFDYDLVISNSNPKILGELIEE